MNVCLTLIEIEKYIKERDDAGNNICFARFLQDKQEFIIENSSGLKDYRSFWSHSFGIAAGKLNVKTVINK